MCKYLDLPIGTLGHFIPPNVSCCLSCGSMVDMVGVNFKYIGSLYINQDYIHKLELLDLVVCPGCGQTVTQYNLYCDEGSLSFQLERVNRYEEDYNLQNRQHNTLPSSR